MTESRDRLIRAVDVAAVYARRRRSFISGGNGSGEACTVLVDYRGDPPPFRWGSMPLTGPTTLSPWITTGKASTRGRIGVAEASVGGGGVGDIIRRGRLGTRRIWRGRSSQISSGTVLGRQNISPATRSSRGRVRGRGRGQGDSILPEWYPRVPLQEVTHIVRAIERRRARLREDEGHQHESPRTQEQPVLDPSVSTAGAQLEHDTSTITPYPVIRRKPFPVSAGQVPKILLDINKKNAGDSADLTPQRKLLNSIDTVEKVVMEELHKLKRTPTAKKAEREKKVRILMSMR